MWYFTHKHSIDFPETVLSQFIVILQHKITYTVIEDFVRIIHLNQQQNIFYNKLECFSLTVFILKV